MALDESDGLALDQYIGTVVGMQFFRMIMIREIDGNHIGRQVDTDCFRLSLRSVERWPRLRSHWRRFQRRLCHNCQACVHLSEPRYMVCSGCGVARYCSEHCQEMHWPDHQKACLALQKSRDRIRIAGKPKDKRSRFSLTKGEASRLTEWP